MCCFQDMVLQDFKRNMSSLSVLSVKQMKKLGFAKMPTPLVNIRKVHRFIRLLSSLSLHLHSILSDELSCIAPF
jgi:hypothetical protein